MVRTKEIIEIEILEEQLRSIKIDNGIALRKMKFKELRFAADIPEDRADELLKIHAAIFGLKSE